MILWTSPSIERFPRIYLLIIIIRQFLVSSPIYDAYAKAYRLVIERCQHYCIRTGRHKYIGQASDKTKRRPA